MELNKLVRLLINLKLPQLTETRAWHKDQVCCKPIKYCIIFDSKVNIQYFCNLIIKALL